MDSVINIIKHFLQNDELEINADTRLAEDLGMSSFELMELSCEFEDEYDIKFQTDEMINFQSVSQIYEFLKARAVFE
ncbi:MAG: acyl carrier protein [Lachnospiraceae bacterium]|nr:acyl carrier protein [Lachnospiraceae bacterium]